MWIKSSKELKKSNHEYVNFLYNHEKFYIMDNHLCAAWCWLQKVKKTIGMNLFHIDRHYDCLIFSKSMNSQIVGKGIDLPSLKFQEYCNLTTENGNPIKLFKFDNYIGNLLIPFPQFYDSAYFATHKDDTDCINIKTYEPTIIEMNTNIHHWIKSPNWILNIDIDYFFTEDSEGRIYQFVSDAYIYELVQNIKACIDKIDVVTIAMSPNFCGGWENSYRVLKIFTEYFNLDFRLEPLEKK